MKSIRILIASHVLFTVVAALVLSIAAPCMAAPALNGDISDVIAYAQSLQAQGGCAAIKDDATQDIRLMDPQSIPCVPVVDNYYVTDLDMVKNAFGYDAASHTLYLGLRSAGIMGDPDGNGDPNTTCAQSTIDDGPGISGGEIFRWRLRGLTGASGDVILNVTDNVATVTGVPGASAEFAFAGHDLEVAIHGVTIGSYLDVFVMAMSLTDMLGEDAAHVAWIATHGETIAPDPGIVRAMNSRATQGSARLRSGTQMDADPFATTRSISFGELKATYHR